jgi:rubrerythrin
MKKMTQKNLSDAFAGESQAHMKYLAFADKAEKEGHKDVARLFRAIAYAEQVHATNHLKELGLLNDTKENLLAAREGENFEIEEMYPAYKAVAELQEEKGALRSINYALEAEKIHRELYDNVKKELENGKEVKLDKIYICPVCGYTVVGEVPEKCPVCGAPKSSFKEF